MDMFRTLIIQLHQLTAAQMGKLDPNTGTLAAYENAKARLQDPTMYDAIFPVIAFFLVIILPTCIAFWVIFKTVTEKDKEADES
jgi:hypothetical protein